MRCQFVEEGAGVGGPQHCLLLLLYFFKVEVFLDF